MSGQAPSLKHEFLLDPAVTFLNHGSYGACPRAVFEAYQSHQLELEREPVDFLQRTFPSRMRMARERLAQFLTCGADEVVFVRNATYGMNLVARSLQLGPGDTVLATDQEYGAVDRMWQSICAEVGANFVRSAIPLPADSPEAVTTAVANRLDPSVRVVTFPHISAQLAQVFPVAEIVALAREAGAISVIDGAHAPGQLPLDLHALDADFYVGNCHKWMLAPKGAAFVHAAQRWTGRIRPPVIGWGTVSDGNNALLLENEWQGTSDISAFLAVADAIDFMQRHRWFDELIPACARLLDETAPILLAATGQESLYINPVLRPPQLASYRLRDGDHSNLHATLFNDHQIEVPVFNNHHGTFLRVSIQAYNQHSDLERLAAALRELTG